MGARLTALAIFAAIAIGTANALADVEIQGDRGALDPRVLDELVRLELGATLIDRIVVRLEGDRADVEVIAEERRRRGAVAIARGQSERTIALFVGELARRLDAEPDPPTPTPTTAPTPPSEPSPTRAPPPATPDPAREADGRVRPYVLATGGARWLVAGGAVLASPRAEGGLLVSDALRVGLVARYAYGAGDDLLGTARLHAITGGLAATWTLARAIATGPRIEIGAFAASGDGQNASSTSALATSAAWELELRAPVGRSFALLLAVDAGWYVQGLELRADDRAVLDVSGPFAGAAIGAAFLPPRPITRR